MSESRGLFAGSGLTGEQRQRNRRTGVRLVLVVVGLMVFSILYIIVYARYFKGSA